MDTNSTPDAAATRKPKGRIGKFLLRGAMALIVVAIVAHFAWKYSGSNQWKKVEEHNGVTIYAMKSPGNSIEKFKAVWTIHSRMSKFVMWASDHKGDTPHSMRKETGLYDHRTLGEQGERIAWSAWKQPLAPFLQPREFVIKSEFSQDPKSKVLLYTVTGVPDKIPPNDCCVRVPVMNNSWTLTPLQNGDIQVEWLSNMDIGGVIPYPLQNEVQPGGMLKFAPKVIVMIEQDKYKNAKYDWVQE